MYAKKSAKRAKSSFLGKGVTIGVGAKKKCRATGFITGFVEIAWFSKQCACITLIKPKSILEKSRTYQYTFLAFWIEVTVWTSFKVCFVFFSADLNAYLYEKSF